MENSSISTKRPFVLRWGSICIGCSFRRVSAWMKKTLAGNVLEWLPWGGGSKVRNTAEWFPWGGGSKA